MEVERLVPFHYFGVKDEIDYANIPWRNKRFDPEVLAEAAQTEARMETFWRTWHEHPGARTLIFCCSIAHADFVREWLFERGVRAAAVYSGEGTDDRETAIQRLSAGEIDALCSVDVFNEGIDVPSVDRVVMLRPTESGVIFLQQLGRGLRAAPGKSSVTVVDFVGNHRIFLERLRTLLSLGGREAPSLRTVLESDADKQVDLPGGCSVHLELEAKILLSRMFRVSASDEVGRADSDDARWAIPEVDHATWRKWGHGRDTSRRLPDGARARAQVIVDALVGLPEETRWIERADHRRARVLGTAPRGGIRIDGGEGGFNERTVSLTDLAWVIVAADDVRQEGGLLDEARVNRLRYLDGTPKGATRWIDTGWAIAAWNAGKHLARQVTVSAAK